jgi:hypothetical protein
MPLGIDIPASLVRLPGTCRRGPRAAVPAAGALLDEPVDASWAARLVHVSIPSRVGPAEALRITLQVANVGREPWLMGAAAGNPGPRVGLRIDVDGRAAHWEPLREHVSPGCRGHFAFDVSAPRAGTRRVALALEWQAGPPGAETGIALHECLVHLEAPPAPWASLLRRARAALRA